MPRRTAGSGRFYGKMNHIQWLAHREPIEHPRTAPGLCLDEARHAIWVVAHGSGGLWARRNATEVSSISRRVSLRDSQ